MNMQETVWLNQLERVKRNSDLGGAVAWFLAGLKSLLVVVLLELAWSVFALLRYNSLWDQEVIFAASQFQAGSRDMLDANALSLLKNELLMLVWLRKHSHEGNGAQSEEEDSNKESHFSMILYQLAAFIVRLWV